MPTVSPAMRMGPDGGCRSAVAAAICLRQARCRATALGVRSARLCHKCQRSASWTAPGPVAGAPRRRRRPAAHRWLAPWQRRPGPWRRRGRGAARSHRRRPRPAPHWPQDRAGRRPLAACRLLPGPPSLTGLRPVAVPVIRRALVTAHMLQASMTTKPATATKTTSTTTPASSSPTPARNPSTASITRRRPVSW